MSDPITFSELRKIQKQEARQDELTELEEDFLLRVGDYFERKKEAAGEDREYRNAKRVFEKIISLREDKVFKNAKISAKSGSEASDLELLPIERELFLELRQGFRDHRKRAEKRTEKDIDIQSREEEGKPEEEPEEKEYHAVKITSQVPEFLGTDLETYGPFEEGEEVEVPEENAEILVNRGSAEEVEE